MFIYAYFVYFNSVGSQLATQIGKDETNVENITRTWRPSTIKEKYATLYFQTACTLKTELVEKLKTKDGSSREFIDRVFCAVYMVSGVINIVPFIYHIFSIKITTCLYTTQY